MGRFDKDRLGRIGRWMQGYVDERRYAGCSVLIAEGDREIYFHACGLRDVAKDQPFQRDTVARIYSMTKPITTVAMMQFVERGLVHLDAPVSDFIPAFSDMQCLVPGATRIDQIEACAAPSLHQLLTHTSGLSYAFNPGILAQEMAAQKIDFNADRGSLAAMTDRVAALPLAFKPSSRWEYSVGIDVIGRVIEVITGRTFEDYLIDEVLEPLRMAETRFSLPKTAIERFACAYTPLTGSGFDLNDTTRNIETLREADRPETSPFLAATMHSGGGGLVGTIDDYLKFTEMLRTGGNGILSPKTLSFMMRNHLPGDIASMGPASFAEQPMEGMGFGLGGAVVLNPGRTRVLGSIGDFGWGGMASTFFWVDPVCDISVVFFTQLLPSSAYPARAQLKALVHGAMTS